MVLFSVNWPMLLVHLEFGFIIWPFVLIGLTVWVSDGELANDVVEFVYKKLYPIVFEPSNFRLLYSENTGKTGLPGEDKLPIYYPCGLYSSW